MPKGEKKGKKRRNKVRDAATSDNLIPIKLPTNQAEVPNLLMPPTIIKRRERELPMMTTVPSMVQLINGVSVTRISMVTTSDPSVSLPMNLIHHILQVAPLVVPPDRIIPPDVYTDSDSGRDQMEHRQGDSYYISHSTNNENNSSDDHLPEGTLSLRMLNGCPVSIF